MYKHLMLSTALMLSSTMYAMEQTKLKDKGNYQSTVTNSKNHEYYSQLIEHRIEQGLTGKALAAPDDYASACLPCKLINQGHLDLLQKLLEAKADPNGLDLPTTPLLAAAAQRSLPAITLLVSHQANVNSTRNNETPLHKITSGPITRAEPSVEIMRYLLEHNASPNLQDSCGDTPLMKIAKAKTSNIPLEVQKKLASTLIRHGALISIRSKNNLGMGLQQEQKTPFQIALIGGKPNLAALIKEMGFQNGQVHTEEDDRELEKELLPFSYTDF